MGYSRKKKRGGSGVRIMEFPGVGIKEIASMWNFQGLISRGGALLCLELPGVKLKIKTEKFHGGFQKRMSSTLFGFFRE